MWIYLVWNKQMKRLLIYSDSSLQNNIFISFWHVLVFWRLLTHAFLFLANVIIVQKKFFWRPNITFTLEKKERNTRIVILEKKREERSIPREKVSLSCFYFPWEKYLVALLGAGSTQNDLYQQCNFGERARGKKRKLKPHPYNVKLISPVELFWTTMTSQLENFFGRTASRIWELVKKK